ncbi:hypothetical protein [Azonexus sp.]|uniref:hypothetical protein n=1 Tax=Azonexus sp. TaxID=1872668 RepID=UPI0035B4D986
MQALLSFESSPPLAAPLRFFASAPWFLVGAGLLLAWAGPDAFASRWMPATLAATHLVTLGFMLQVMLGALIQVLPVVAGASLARPGLVAGVVQPALAGGALLLAAAFLSGQPWLFAGATLLLLGAVVVFLGVAAAALSAVPGGNPTVSGIKFALAGLAGVALLGGALALGLAGGWPLPYPALTDLHAAWGLAAWAGVLLAALAGVVVPMFQLTPPYPARFGRLFPALSIGLALAWSLALVADWPRLAEAARFGTGLAGMVFCGLTLRLQQRRRRAKPDATSRAWQMGMAAGFLACLMQSTAALFPELPEAAGWTTGFGLLIGGAFVCCIVGMLYKILPFLCWLSLQHHGVVRPPSMNRLLDEPAMQRQLWAQAGALALLFAAAWLPGLLARPAGLAFAAASAGLALNLRVAVRRYREHLPGAAFPEGRTA